MSGGKTIFLVILAWLWVLFYAWEYKEPNCYLVPVLARIERHNTFTGATRYEITVTGADGQPLTIRRAGSGANYHARKYGRLLICQDTGRLTRIKSPWYTPY